MYSIKNALLTLKDLPHVKITIFYIDTRAFGKNYEPFLRKAKEEGIRFIKAKPVIKGSGANKSVILRYEDQEASAGIIEEEYDLAVLCLAIVPAWNPEGKVDMNLSEDGFLASASPKMAPALTNMEGIFIGGVISGPKDIVDTIIEAGAAAMEASNYLKGLEQKDQRI
jgi:heterodisulfide reductase subunit A2